MGRFKCREEKREDSKGREIKRRKREERTQRKKMPIEKRVKKTKGDNTSKKKD